MLIKAQCISLQSNRTSRIVLQSSNFTPTGFSPASMGEIIEDKTEATKVCLYVCIMQPAPPAWAGPPPPSSQSPRVEDNELSSYLGEALENGDAACDGILRAFRGTHPEILLGWHSTSHPNHRMWFTPQLKYPSIFREYPAKLFHVPVPLFLRVVLIFFVSICIWLVCLSIKSCCCFSSRRGTVALFIQENFSKKEIFKTFSRWSTLPSVRCHTP